MLVLLFVCLDGKIKKSISLPLLLLDQQCGMFFQSANLWSGWDNLSQQK
jgi:hypothetical protein